MCTVVALGGNALLKRGESLTAENQRRNMRAAAADLAAIARERALVIVHGNGPQVGLLALEAEAYRAIPPYPLDILGAESQGMIGYVIQQELRNRLPDREIVTILTETVVDADDPAFARLTKPIGPVYAQAEAEALAKERGWTVASDGAGFRRVVASPDPVDFVGMPVIRNLVEKGAIVICAGGGGVPVAERAEGSIGLEAVIDKDLAAALLAERLAAESLIILTDVAGVYRGWGGGHEKLMDEATVSALRGMWFEPGTMAPKVEAACRFVEHTGARAMIGGLARALDVAAGRSGTHVIA